MAYCTYIHAVCSINMHCTNYVRTFKTYVRNYNYCCVQYVYVRMYIRMYCIYIPIYMLYTCVAFLLYVTLLSTGFTIEHFLLFSVDRSNREPCWKVTTTISSSTLRKPGTPSSVWRNRSVSWRNGRTRTSGGSRTTRWTTRTSRTS